MKTGRLRGMKMEQLSLPFARVLKVGDKVMIIGKTGLALPCFGWDVGCVAYIGLIENWTGNKETYFLKISITDEFCMGGRFAFNDLRRV